MTLALVMTAGPQFGSWWQLDDGHFSLGRHTRNRLQLKDLSVSRFHCELQPTAKGWLVTDLKSRSGTFVNRKPVHAQLLKVGDLIDVGNNQLRLVESKCLQSEAPKKTLLPNASTASIYLNEARYLEPQKVLQANPQDQQVHRALGVLLAMSGELNRIKDPETLARAILRQLLDAIPLQQAAIVFQASEGLACDRIFAAQNGGRDAFEIQAALVDRVCRDQTAMLCDEENHGSQLKAKPGRVQAIICAPLFGPSQCLGALYAEQHTGRPLDQQDLQLATAIAHFAAAPLEHSLQWQALQQENQRLRGNFHHGMIGESPAMQEIYRLIQKVASANTTVLIRGESGTGKELAARALYRNGPRSAKPFIAINCAVLSENLLNSELFGHERGAFTGAISRKIGKLEQANGGTLFLDEAGELPPEIQAKLLRVLQEREFERLGGNHTIKVDLRIIAATNRNLETAIKQGQFREDLYYRLNVISFTMPPLRERDADILLLANWFAAKHANALSQPVFGISSWAKKCLAQYDWPGNVRELSNAIERATVLGEDQLIRVEDLPEQIRERQSLPENASPANYQAALNQTKRTLIQQAVRQSNGNITQAAASLDLHPNYLHRLIRNLGIKDRLPKRHLAGKGNETPKKGPQ